MKVLLNYFISFHKETKHSWPLYILITVFIATITAINYTYKMERWLDRLKPDWLPYLGHFILFNLIYWFIVFLCYRFKVIDNVFKNKAFILKSLFMLSILTVDVCFKYHHDLVIEYFSSKDRLYMYRLSNQLTSLLTAILPLFLYYYWKEKTDNTLYGLKASARKIGQYFPLVLLMIPLIAIASFEQSFRDYYPIFKPNYLFMDWSVELRATVFEIFYGLDFISTEFVFRGFMVLGFTAFLGPRAILPMVGLYVALHYGKPLGETIGSFFGGYILGVLAYQSKNIWGGIMAHMGVAYLMELFAWLQKTFNE